MKQLSFYRILLCLMVINFMPPVYSQIRIATSEVNPEYLRWIAEKKQMITSEGHALGEIPLPYKIHTELPAGLKDKMLKIEFAPVSYDLRNSGGVTSVKDQGGCGSCWTFATMGAIESRWLVNGRGTYDLSEDNLNTCHPPFVWLPCEGGNTFLSSAYLMRGSGPISEADDPYSESHTSVDCPSGLEPQGLVTSAWFLPTSDPDLIKNYIMQYGAVATNMYWTSSAYNAADYTYYYSGPADGTNHAVTLIGWDDDKTTAGGTGAWIIKNSWGPAWGESGYFYIAYQDVEVNSTVTAFQNYTDFNAGIAVSTYSESGWLGNNIGIGEETIDGLVRFVANGNVELTDIGTFVNQAGTIVTIEIYDNFDGSSSLTGLLGSISSQTCPYTGYHSFSLSSPINVSDGDDYYVKITYETAGYIYPLPVEEAISGFSTPDITSGVSWAKNVSSTSWISLDGYDWDLCIYAYTSPVSESVATPIFDPVPGSYPTTQDISISCSTPDATIYYTTNGSDPTESDSEYSIPVNIASTTTLKARAFKTDYNASDIATGIYSIEDLSVVTPNGGEDWQAGTSHDIIWTSYGTSGNVHIEYSANNGTDWADVIASTTDIGSYSWIVPNVPSINCLVRISDIDGSPSDQSDAVFTISPPPSITITSPNGGEDWVLGSSQDITWTSYDTSEDVYIEYSTNNGTDWADIAVSTANDGLYSWIVPDEPSTTCLIRISDFDGDPTDQSDAVFTISVVPTITLTSPNGSENWQAGSNHEITWTSTGTIGNIHIEYSTDNGTNWDDLITSTNNDGSHSWLVPNESSTNCLIRVGDTDGSPTDQSDAVFTISPLPVLTITSPNGGENWQTGSSHEITWTSIGTSGNVHIEYSTNNGTGWVEVVASTTDDGSHSWLIPEDPSTSCLVRISDTDEDPFDISDAVFTIDMPDATESLINAPIHIYPNPSSEFVYIAFENGINAEVTIEIIDILGQVVSIEKKEMNKNVIELNIADLRSGLYFIKMATSNDVYTSTVIVEE